MAPDQMQVQARIQAARQEAENLKTKIKRRKDELADTSRELTRLAYHPVVRSGPWLTVGSFRM